MFFFGLCLFFIEKTRQLEKTFFFKKIVFVLFFCKIHFLPEKNQVNYSYDFLIIYVFLYFLSESERKNRCGCRFIAKLLFIVRDIFIFFRPVPEKKRVIWRSIFTNVKNVWKKTRFSAILSIFLVKIIEDSSYLTRNCRHSKSQD